MGNVGVQAVVSKPFSPYLLALLGFFQELGKMVVGSLDA